MAKKKTKKKAARKAVKKVIKKAAKKPAKKAAPKKKVAKKKASKKPVKKVAPKKKAAKKKASNKPVKKSSVVSKTAKKTISKRAKKASGGAGKVIAKVDVGWGNTLYLRGDGAGLSWSCGVSLVSQSANEWVWEVPSTTGDFEYKLLINDVHWSEGSNFVAKKGKLSVVTPVF